MKENRKLKKAKLGIYNREISRLNRTRIFGLASSIFLKIGEILTAEGKLKHREDIFYLFLDEINEKDSYIGLVKARKIEYRKNENIPAYSRLVYADEIVEKHFEFQEKYEIDAAGIPKIGQRMLLARVRKPA